MSGSFGVKDFLFGDCAPAAYVLLAKDISRLPEIGTAELVQGGRSLLAVAAAQRCLAAGASYRNGW